MSIIKNRNSIGEIIINNKNISEIYKGNTLVYLSMLKIPEIVFREIDENGNLTLPSGSLQGLFDNIKTISTEGLSYAYYKCTGITSVSFPSLISVEYGGLRSAFENCISISGSISFPVLNSIGSFGLGYIFRGCTGITEVKFPALTSVDTNGLSNAFKNCTNLRQIHFRADARSVIEALYEYSDKFGAPNATIYFDL